MKNLKCSRNYKNVNLHLKYFQIKLLKITKATIYSKLKNIYFQKPCWSMNHWMVMNK